MLYTVVMGRMEYQHPYQTSPSFVAVQRVTVEAPSAGDARVRVEAAYKALVSWGVVEPTDRDRVEYENLQRVSSPAYKAAEKAVARETAKRNS